MIQFCKEHMAACTVAGVLAAVYLLSRITGLGLCAVQSGSMEPAIPTYSLCLVTTRVAYTDLEIGDIVVYIRAEDGEKIIHRVTDITDRGAVTKGDANLRDDGVSVTPHNLYARYIGHVPFAGRIFRLVRSPYGAAGIAGLAAALLVLDIVDAKCRRKSQPRKIAAGDRETEQ